MHYGTETFSVGGEERPTMTRRHSDCDLRWVGAAFDMRHGSEVASPSDWELLKRIGARLCKTTTNPTTTTKTTTNPTPTTTKTTTTSTVQTTADSFEKTTKPTSSKVAKKHVKSVWRPLSKGKKKTKPKVIRRPA